MPFTMTATAHQKEATFYKRTTLIPKDCLVDKLAQTVFTDEDKRDLIILAEEMPDLRLLVEELMETLEILGDENLTKALMQARKAFKKTG
jgi:hypothetical protein